MAEFIKQQENHMKNYFPILLIIVSMSVGLYALTVYAQTGRGNLSMDSTAIGTANGTQIPSSANADPAATANISGAIKIDPPLKSGGASSTAMGWSDENEYWNQHYSTRPYYNKSTSYSTFAPAYQYGFDAYGQYSGKSYDMLDQAQLRAAWERDHGNSGLKWEEAQPAIRDAYERMHNNRMGKMTDTVQ
jgi:hypothetical protein